MDYAKWINYQNGDLESNTWLNCNIDSNFHSAKLVETNIIMPAFCQLYLSNKDQSTKENFKFMI